jgi:flagellar basal-body rod protein FlgC
MAEVKNIFDIAGRAMASQMVRLNTVASNLANAGTISGSKEEAYRALKPVFETQFSEALKDKGISTVDVVGIEAITRDPERVFLPNHPSADGEGYVYRAAVDENEEMIEMVEAGRQYTNNIEVISTLRGLMMRTINMGK